MVSLIALADAPIASWLGMAFKGVSANKHNAPAAIAWVMNARRMMLLRQNGEAIR